MVSLAATSLQGKVNIETGAVQGKDVMEAEKKIRSVEAGAEIAVGKEIEIGGVEVKGEVKVEREGEGAGVGKGIEIGLGGRGLLLLYFFLEGRNHMSNIRNHPP